MPVHRPEDGKGPYDRCGKSGRKYHDESGNKETRDHARARAEEQGRAVRASGYDG